MATQVIGHQRATAIPQGPKVGWNSVRDFLTSMGELAGIYFASPWNLDVLDPQYRAKLSVKEKAEIDTYVLGGLIH